ncbi:hypothetical protein JCM1393_17980 [Clostridium carnis]
MGNDKAWGIDKEFYIWSDWIIYAIAGLDNEIFEGLITDKSLPISKFFDEVPKRIKTLFSSEKKKSFSYNDDLRHNFKNYIVLISLMHKLGKIELLTSILSEYKEIKDLCKTNKFYFNSTSNKDNFLVWRSLIYIDTVIFKEKVDELISLALEKSQDINANDLFKDYISVDILYLSSLYYNILIYHEGKCIDMIKSMNINQLSIFAITASKPECLKSIIKSKKLINAIKMVLETEINSEGLSSVICLALKKLLGCFLSKKEKNIVDEYFKSVNFRKSSIFWREHYDIVALIMAAFGEKDFKIECDIEVRRYANIYCVFLELINGCSSLAKFICCVQKNVYNNTEDSYYTRILLGKTLALSNDDETNIKGAVDYLNNFMKDGRSLIVYHTMKLYNPSRFKRLLSISNLNKLNVSKVYQDIDFTSTSESFFMLSFILSSHDKLLGHELLLKGISNGLMRMNDRKDTIADYNLLDSLEILLKNNWVSTEELISFLKRILKVANRMNSYHIENDTHKIVMDILQKYDFDAAKFYYDEISGMKECYDLIHYGYAATMTLRGENIDDIEACLDKIVSSFDRYHQKLEWNSFYYKIKVYLKIAESDFYQSYEQKLSFERVCNEINSLEDAGWSRELKKKEYEIYIQLCKRYNKEIDVDEEKEITYSVKSSNNEKYDIIEIINSINTEKDLSEFIEKLDSVYVIDNLEANQLFINKCIDINGNIDEIINMLAKYNYPSSLLYSRNNNNFWMTIVECLKNENSKSAIVKYLLKSGGGHDGFNELIKIYGYLGNKEICIRSFEKMLACIEFLLC